MAVVFTCDDCAAEYLPGAPGKLSEIRGAATYPGDPHVAIVHPSCAADFVANGFEIVPGIVEGTDEPGFFCPHLP